MIWHTPAQARIPLMRYDQTSDIHTHSTMGIKGRKYQGMKIWNEENFVIQNNEN